MTVDIDKLRALLAAVPCAECWGRGPVSGCIETSQRAPNGDIYGLTLFEPDEVNEQTLAEAELACAAVNALPQLLAIAEAAFDVHSDHDEAEIKRMTTSIRELYAAVDAARKAGT